MIHCLHCGAETSNGLALCELCRRKASTILEFLPIYFRNLARWRPGGAGGRRVPGSREPVLGGASIDRVAVAIDEVGNDLSTWARVLADDRPYLGKLLARLDAADLDEVQVARWLCRGFEKYLTSISTLEWCGEFVKAIGEHEERLSALTLEVVPGWYAGGCRLCSLPTYVVPGLTWVMCGHCGATTAARDHVETIMGEARDWVAPPMRLAEAIVALLDTEMSVPRLYERIKKWRVREKVTGMRRLDVDGREVGAYRYQFGEVLDLVLAEGQTRLDTPIAAAAS